MSNFQAAAVSYFGLPEDTVLIPSDPGYVAFHVELTQAVLAGIAERMAVLGQAQAGEAVAAPFFPDLPRFEMRVKYNALSKEEKGRYGSFARFCSTYERDADGKRDLPAPPTEWRRNDDLTEQQKLDALDSEVRDGVVMWLVPMAEPAPHPLRAEWDSMLPHQRTIIGSFEEYCAMRALRDEPEEKPLDVKWIAAADLTDEQIRGAMGEHAGKYAIQVDNLTDAQRAAL